MDEIVKLEQQFSAHNYAPLPVVLQKGKGIYVWDTQGKRYIDMMSAYSAVSHGHTHPEIIKTLTQQAETLSLVSRAYYTDQLGPFLKLACELTHQDVALPMNSGAEAVETAIKAARKWAYTVKGVPHDKAEIIVCSGNFHGRTTTIISFSSEDQYKAGFEPLTPGFVTIPYGDSEALARAISPQTAAFLVEPIQGEGGILIPPEGYLKKCAEICKANNVLLICDEIQTGLGRTGKLLASEHENVIPDGLILGKALSGGVFPVSLFLSKKTVMDVFSPGDHGSTFGGNPLACAVGRRALELIVEEKFAERSAELGAYFFEKLSTLKHPIIKDIRGRGLFIGIEIDTTKLTARELCIALIKNGILSKDTHDTVIRFAPPLIITQAQLDEAFEMIRRTFDEVTL